MRGRIYRQPWLLRQFHRDGLIRLVVARESLQDGRILRPFFKHLGRGLDEIILQVALSPRGIALHDSVDEMSILVEEGDDVVALH